MNQTRIPPFFYIKAIPAAVLTAIVFLSITTWLCWLSLQASKEDAQRQLQESVFQHHASIQNELEHEVSRLESFVSLYHLSPAFDRYAFHSFAKIENQPWLVAKLFSKRVKAQELESFESAVKTDTTVDVRGYPDFHIQDKVAKQDALVALYLEPRQRLQKIHGLNMEKWFPSARKRMIETGQALSFMVKNTHPLLHENDIVLSIPVFETGLPIRHVIQREIAFSGIFTTVISVDTLLNTLLSSPNLHLTSVVLSGTGMAEEALEIALTHLCHIFAHFPCQSSANPHECSVLTEKPFVVP